MNEFVYRLRLSASSKNISKDEANCGISGEDKDDADSCPDQGLFTMLDLVRRSGRRHPGESAVNENDQRDRAGNAEHASNDNTNELLRR